MFVSKSAYSRKIDCDLKMCSLLLIAIFIFSVTNSCAGAEGNLLKYLQPNDADKLYSFDNSSTSCTRECIKDAPPRICYYQFNLENYATLTEACLNCTITGESCDLPQCVTADGYVRGFFSVNRMLPGPSIQVCHRDRIIVDLINKMPGRSPTIHWHGIFQNGTPYHDGVPGITQCPVNTDNTFRYDFTAHPHGTYFWHTHDGVEKVDGLQGSLIVRRPKEEDPHNDLYDLDLPAHNIFLVDWFHEDSDQHFPGLIYPNRASYATFYLVNGLGKYKDPTTGTLSNSSFAVFRVTPGKRYRFRLIGATCLHCFARVNIEGHRLTLIAADGNSVKPMDIDYLEISSGERYDFILNADQEVKSYWIQVKGLGPCQKTKSRQLAILQYEDSDGPLVTSASFNFDGTVLNPENSTCNGPNGVCVAQLKAIENLKNKAVLETPDVSYVMTFGFTQPTTEKEFQSNTYQLFTYPQPGTKNTVFWINNIVGIFPPSPILSQRHDISADIFCPEGQGGQPVCNTSLCYCFHVLRVPLGALAQFILVDRTGTGGFNHVFHLHGYAFNVMAMGNLESGYDNVENLQTLVNTSNFIISEAPPLKDTIAIPSEGYAVIRFVADNPGYWLFHCHFLYHHFAGMVMVIQVGEPEDNPPVPRGFPTCRNYLPEFDEKNKHC